MAECRENHLGRLVPEVLELPKVEQPVHAPPRTSSFEPRIGARNARAQNGFVESHTHCQKRCQSRLCRSDLAVGAYDVAGDAVE